MQILGFLLCYVSNEDHACNLSYNKDTKQWVYSDPTSGVPNFDVYSRAASDWFKIDDVSGLKKITITLNYIITGQKRQQMQNTMTGI